MSAPSPPPAGTNVRGRDREYENNRRIAGQVARLLDAGAHVDELSMLDILGLLKIRGLERGGLARQTHDRLRNKYRAEPDRYPTLLDLLAIHRPAEWGNARLSFATGLYAEHLPVRLLLGASPSEAEVVHAELLAVAGAHQRGNRPDAAAAAREWAGLADQMAGEASGLDGPHPPRRSVQQERFARRFRRIRDDSDIRYVDGTLVQRTPAGLSIVDLVVAPFVFRWQTAQHAADADSDPRAGLAELEEHWPGHKEQRMLEQSLDGQAALLERCFLVLETYHLAKRRHGALLTTAKTYLANRLPQTTQVTRGQDGGHRHACLNWPDEERRIFWRRAAAAKRHLNLQRIRRPARPARDEMAPRGHSAPGGLAGVRADLAELAPLVLKELTTGPDADPELVAALSSRDAYTNAWLMSPARQRAYLEVVNQLVDQRRQRYASADKAARTVVRNLVTLNSQLSGGEVDPEVWAQLVMQMTLVSARVEQQLTD